MRAVLEVGPLEPMALGAELKGLGGGQLLAIGGVQRRRIASLVTVRAAQWAVLEGEADVGAAHVGLDHGWRSARELHVLEE